jgi:hypothetical protein
LLSWPESRQREMDILVESVVMAAVRSMANLNCSSIGDSQKTSPSTLSKIREAHMRPRFRRVISPTGWTFLAADATSSTWNSDIRVVKPDSKLDLNCLLSVPRVLSWVGTVMVKPLEVKGLRPQTLPTSVKRLSVRNPGGERGFCGIGLQP